ncbi:hypothetical protein JCM8097_009034 [Rhodosporidiobolus ruineniae]
MPSNPLLLAVDLVSPYLPASLADPLYSLASFDFVNLVHNPLQIFPLLLSLLAVYWAWLSFLSSARFALRTSLALLKWGAIASVLGAVYLGYSGAGTEKGVTGGLNDAARIASVVGRGVYSLGRGGANYYLGTKSSKHKRSAASNQRSASGRPRTWARPTSEGGWDDPNDANRDHEAEQFVGDVLRKAQETVFEFLTPPQEKVKRSAKKGGKQQQGPFDGGIGGLAWDLAMGKAKKAWDEVVDPEAAKKQQKKNKWF